ncbi:MAG TPA: hypothetical protein VII47_06875 [Actinomycetota bacterium]
MIKCDCGQLLLLAVEDNSIVLPSGETVPFRRSTDYVSCDACLRTFPIAELRQRTRPPIPQPPSSAP